MALPFLYVSLVRIVELLRLCGRDRDELAAGMRLLSVDTALLKRMYVLFFIELGTRGVYLAGVTANPVGEWVAQQTRNLTMVLDGEDRPRMRFVM